MFNFKKEKVKKGEYVAVTSGKIIPIEEVKDQVFASKALGDGVAIIPDDDYIVSPCNGVVSMLYPTLHAFGITDEYGNEILVHIGVDTVNLKGKGFRKYVDKDQKVEIGDKIVGINLYDLTNKKIDLTTMMLFPGCKKEIEFEKSGYAKKGKTIVAKVKEEK